jgi:hypothetical protein
VLPSANDEDLATERLMPSIPDIAGPYRFFFYSFDCGEPMHVHVERDRDKCKFWLDPVTLAANNGFTAKELNRIRRTIAENIGAMRDAWSKHCGGSGAAGQLPTHRSW